MFNNNEMEFIARIEEAKMYVKGELELNCSSGEWFAMDYRESCGGAFSIEKNNYDKPLITKKEAKRKRIDVVKCCEYCGIYYAE